MNYKKDTIVKGTVSNIEAYGVFVRLDENNSGLIHISEITDKFVSDINDYVKDGEEIYVKIIDTPKEEGKINLSIKGIDYHYNDQYYIKSTKDKDFEILQNKLPYWISKKLEEFNKSEKK